MLLPKKDEALPFRDPNDNHKMLPPLYSWETRFGEHCMAGHRNIARVPFVFTYGWPIEQPSKIG